MSNRVNVNWVIIVVILLLALVGVSYLFIGKSSTSDTKNAITLSISYLSLLILGSLNIIREFIVHKINRPELLIVTHQKYDQSPSGQTKEKLFIVRLIIKNKGSAIAKKVEADVEKIIEPNNKERDDFYPTPLNWMHSHLNKNGVLHRDIYINQPAYLDILQLRGREGDFSLGLPTWVPAKTNIYQGTTFFSISFYEESGYKKTIYIQVVWNGTKEIDVSILNKINTLKKAGE